MKRSLYGYGSICTTFLAINLMPVSIAVSIMMSTTFVTALLAYFISGESLSYGEIITITLGFTGVLILVNPSIFESDGNNDIEKYPHFILGCFYAIMFSIFSALNFLSMREIGNAVHSSVKTYYFGALSTFLTLLYLCFF
jgi:drug/metabolite transporter (DMT)-like permease